MIDNVTLITTSDGSHSLLNTSLNETYHSIHGAIQESTHIFIKNGFDFVCERSSGNPISIFEMGFGTGLNVWLTALRALKTDRQVHYTTLETFPLPEAVWSQFNYASSLEEKDLFQKIHAVPWGDDIKLYPGFTLKKIKASLLEVNLGSSVYDLIYFDAFAPGKQPELWEIAILGKIIASMKHQGVFVTYCAKGQLKRDLKGLNLRVETLEGPPGKKEMVRSLKN